MKMELIIKYIEGTTTKEENEVLENWLKSDKKNEYYFKKIKEIFNSPETYEEFSKLDINKDWRLVEQRLKNVPEKNRSLLSRSPFYRILLQTAAVIILAIIINGALYFLKTTPEKNPLQTGYNKIYVPNGQKSEITLADGTKVWINAGSSLKIPTRFDKETRDIWLDGEAFFEVSKNPEKPFFVHTSAINIKVLGTSFNVRAYPEEELIETTLVEGSVTLQEVNGTKVDKKVVNLKPNHKAVYFKNKNAYVSENLAKEIKQPLEIQKILISDTVNAEMASSWKEGKLIFENEKFANIIPQLERYYGVKIKVVGDNLNNMRYTGTIKKLSIEQTIKALQITTPFEYEIDDNSILITSNNKMPMVKQN